MDEIVKKKLVRFFDVISSTFSLVNSDKFYRSVTLEHDVSCLDMSPVSNVDSKDEKSQYVAVGLWTDISARVLKLPTLEELCREQLGGGNNVQFSAFTVQ